MTTYSWKASASADWSLASAWTPSGPPNAAGADAVIGAAGTYDVGVASGETFAVGALSLQSASATLNLAGNLGFAAAGALDLAAGTLDLSGTLARATIAMAGGALDFAGGTLDATKVQGALTVGAGTTATILDGVALTGAGGSGAGALTIGSNARLTIQGNTTLDNAVVTFQAQSTLAGDSTGDGGTLTLGPSLSLQVANKGAGFIGSVGDTVVTECNITETGNTYLVFQSAWRNEGAVSLTNHSVIYVEAPFSNTGTVTVDNSFLYVFETLDTASLGAIHVSDGGELIVDELINTGETLSLGPGTTTGLLDASIVGGVIEETARGYVGNGRTLDGVTVRGVLDVVHGLTIVDGLTLTGIGGTGAGTFRVGPVTNILIDGSTTLDNAAVTLTNEAELVSQDVSGTGQTLTLGSRLVVTFTTDNVIDGGAIAGDTLINQGLIVGGTTLQNTYLMPRIIGANLVNQGTIAIGSGSVMELASTTIRNTGTIAVNGGTLIVAGTLEGLAGIDFSNGGTFILDGDLINGGETLAIGAGTAIGTIVLAGTVTGGVITDAGGGIAVYPQATLAGVTYRGALNAGGLVIQDGITLTGTNGTGPGILNLQESLYFEDTSTFDNVTVSVGGQVLNDPTNAGNSLTFGPALVLRDANGLSMSAGTNVHDSLINQGRIIASSRAGKGIRIQGNAFTNQGTLSVVNGESLVVQTTTFGNLSAGTFSGGRYWVGAGSVFEIDAGSVTNLAANLTLFGSGSVLRTVTTGGTVALEASLTAIAATGTLALLGGRSYASGNTLTDHGLITLGGGTLGLGGLTLAAGAHLTGFGTVASKITDLGVVDAKGGLLLLAATVTGSGALRIEAASTLELAAASSGVAFADATGTLRLDAAASFSGPIGGLSVGDAVTFVNETVTSAIVAGGTLTVTGSGGTTRYAVSGALAGNHFAVQSDAHTIKLVAGAAHDAARDLAAAAIAAPHWTSHAPTQGSVPAPTWPPEVAIPLHLHT